ncbi:tryptophan synthase subunit alpha [beta proteobacterium AAP99]|nr:tryptophan synthase subunit alpha [beta proteobacterium AAP99]
MERIDARFASLKAAGRKGLIPFFTAGDPAPESTVPLLHALARAGADVIELGVPFSDPMADGPVIQRSSERALARGVGLKQVLAWVAQFRAEGGTTPVVLMGYANPIERMGLSVFAAAAREAGVDGVLVVDYPPEEADDYAATLTAAGLAPIFLLAPTSTADRIAAVVAKARGYIYYVSLTGVTGASTLNAQQVAGKLPEIQAKASVPVGVGFGIRDAESARAVARTADAVVIGSRIIQLMEEAGDAARASDAIAAAEAFLATIRASLDSGV